MNLRICLLDENNMRLIDGLTIAQRVRAQGKARLWSERSGQPVDTVVIHSMSAVHVDPQRPHDEELILRIFCDYGVSAHYLIDRQGGILLLAPEEMKAWHCGGSIMPPPDYRQSVNDFSIGIELVASPSEAFTDTQYHAIGMLCDDIEQRCGRPLVYVGHEDIAGEAAVRLGLRAEAKTDPGPLFRWERLANRRHLAAPMATISRYKSA